MWNLHGDVIAALFTIAQNLGGIKVAFSEWRIDTLVCPDSEVFFSIKTK